MGGRWQARAMAGIYLRHGEAYIPMRETAYEAEDVLQQLIAEHPEMLAGDDRHGRLVLVSRDGRQRGGLP